MATKMQNMKGLFTDVKTRTIIIFTIALLAIGIVVGVVGISKKPKPTSGPSSTAPVPTVESVPGLKAAPSVQYAQTQALANQLAAQQAAKTGKSAIPTLIGAVGANGPAVAATPTGPVVPVANTALTQPAPVAALTAPMLTVQTMTAEQAQQARQGLQGQLNSLIAGWTKAPTSFQATNSGRDANGGAGANGTAGAQPGAAAGGAAAANGGPLQGGEAVTMPGLRAGDILFAVLDTAVNSDEPGPVLATVVGGPYVGAKLLGDMKINTQSVTLEFKTINLPNSVSSFSITAVAIDPDTARTALATGVNNHYLTRFGGLFAAAFMQGYAQAITSSGTSTIVTPVSTQVTTPTLTAHQQVLAALGQVGQTWGQQLQQYVNIPPTIKVKQGTSVGILLTADFVSATMPTSGGAANGNAPGH